MLFVQLQKDVVVRFERGESLVTSFSICQWMPFRVGSAVDVRSLTEKMGLDELR